MADDHTKLQARFFYCDDECDCTQPLIEQIITNNYNSAVSTNTLWEGQFLAYTYEYSQEEREAIQLAPFREACRMFDVPIPDGALNDNG